MGTIRLKIRLFRADGFQLQSHEKVQKPHSGVLVRTLSQDKVFAGFGRRMTDRNGRIGD